MLARLWLCRRLGLLDFSGEVLAEGRMAMDRLQMSCCLLQLV